MANTVIDNQSINQNNASINVDLHQCDTNTTIFNSTITTNDRVFHNLIQSCNVSCCTSNSLISSNICQVTVQSLTNICLGRLCYSGQCNRFASLANMTHDYQTINKTTIVNTIHSSSGDTPWSSITKWSSWIDETGLTLRHIVLIILLITSVSLSLMTLILVIKSLRHANTITNRKSYRYTLL